MNKLLSCGFILQDKKTKKFLGAIPWGKPERLCDLPKGQRDGDEGYLDCAFRELYEETGITKDEVSDISDLGIFPYLKKKDLYIFHGWADIDVDKLHCDSTFITPWGKEVPEMDGYMLGDLDIFRPAVKETIKKALELLYDSKI